MRFKQLLIAGLLIGWSWIFGLSSSALASIHTYPEQNQQTLYRSRLSAPDNEHQAWQIILFKRVQAGQVKAFQLRLVGFPGQVELSHPASLLLEDSHNHTWDIKDITAEDPQIAPVQSSVGQYNMMDFMGELTQAQRLDIEIPLNQSQTRRLTVPQSMVREWLSLKDIQD